MYRYKYAQTGLAGTSDNYARFMPAEPLYAIPSD